MWTLNFFSVEWIIVNLQRIFFCDCSCGSACSLLQHSVFFDTDSFQTVECSRSIYVSFRLYSVATWLYVTAYYRDCRSMPFGIKDVPLLQVHHTCLGMQDQVWMWSLERNGWVGYKHVGLITLVIWTTVEVGRSIMAVWAVSRYTKEGGASMLDSLSHTTSSAFLTLKWRKKVFFFF